MTSSAGHQPSTLNAQPIFYDNADGQVESGFARDASVLPGGPDALGGGGRAREARSIVRGEQAPEPSAAGDVRERERQGGPGVHVAGGGTGAGGADASGPGSLFSGGRIGAGVQLFERDGIVGIHA